MEARNNKEQQKEPPQQLNQQRPVLLSPRFPNESGPRQNQQQQQQQQQQPPPSLHRLDSRSSLSQFPRQFPPRLQNPSRPPIPGRFPPPGPQQQGIRAPYPQRLPFNQLSPQIRQRPPPLESSNSQIRFAPPRIVTNNDQGLIRSTLLRDKMEEDKIKRPPGDEQDDDDDDDDDDDVVMDDKESVGSVKEAPTSPKYEITKPSAPVLGSPSPVSSPSPKPVTPVPSSSPKSPTPVQTQSPKATTPVRQSPKGSPAPTPKTATTPIPSPSPKAVTPLPSSNLILATTATAPTAEEFKSEQQNQSRPPSRSQNLLEHPPGSRSTTPSSEIKGFDNGKPRSLTPTCVSPQSTKNPSPSPSPSPSPGPPIGIISKISGSPPPPPPPPGSVSPKPPGSPKTPGTPKEVNKKTTFAEDTIDQQQGDKMMMVRASTPAIEKPEPPQCPVDKSIKRSTSSGRSIKSEATTENGTSQGNRQPPTNGVAVSPTKKPSTKPKTVGSPIKSPSKSIKSLPRTPDAGPPSTTEKKKVPMNKVQVGAAPSPNLKTVRSKIGSLDNATYKPGGGKIKIENRKLDFSNAQPKIAAKNDKYMPSGGDKKITQVKLQWNAKPKVGSLDNATYKPGGGDKKIETIKVDFKDKAKPKVGSKDNAKHVPRGGTLKSGTTTPKTPQDDIETQKIDIKAESKIGSMDNVKHKPGGGCRRIFDDKDYLRQMGGASNAQSVNGSGNQSPVPLASDGKNGLPTSDENLNQEY